MSWSCFFGHKWGEMRELKESDDYYGHYLFALQLDYNTNCMRCGIGKRDVYIVPPPVKRYFDRSREEAVRIAIGNQYVGKKK